MNKMSQWLTVMALLVAPVFGAEQLVFEGDKGPGKGKHIVFLASDHEYKAEESCPALARILAKRHGFTCTVLFGQNDKGEIQNGSSNIPGMEALASADLMFLFLRFQNWNDEQFGHFEAYLDRAGPVIGLRTSTHAFEIKDKESKWAKYHWGNKSEDYKLGFGRQVLGETWAGHYGGNHRSSTRLEIVPEKKDHPILLGVKNPWAYCGGYQARPLKPSEILVMAQPLNGITPDSPADEGKKPVAAAWTRSYKGKDGKEGRVFTSTYGSSPDLESDGYRRLLVNAVFWSMGMEKDIKPEMDVSFVGPFNPTFAAALKRKRAAGVKPQDLAGWESPIVPLQGK